MSTTCGDENSDSHSSDFSPPVSSTLEQQGACFSGSRCCSYMSVRSAWRDQVKES